MINKKRAVELVSQMMAIPGKSGEEGAVVEFITRQLVDAGLNENAVEIDSANKRSPRKGETGNLIVKLPGTLRQPRRLLMAHIDTVPLCVGSKPVRKGNLFRSSDPATALGGDDRAGASVVLTAALEILRQKLDHPPLTLFWPVQEEIGLMGARYVSKAKLGNPRLCFNWDGREPNLVVVAATGDYAISIKIDGIASHAGGHPERGVNAAAVASLAIAQLVKEGWHGLILKGKNSGTSNVGVISGGDATNVVMPHLELKAEARSHDPAFRKKIVDAFRSAFLSAAKQVKSDSGQTAKVHFEADLKYEAFRLKESASVVQTALAAIQAAGLEPGTRTSNGGLDANWMTAHGFPTATLGCGQDEIHTVKETLSVPDYLSACEIGLRLATGS